MVALENPECETERIKDSETEPQAERRLESSGGPTVLPEGLYKKIVVDAPIAIVFADKDGIIQLWNEAAQSMFGYPAGEAVGKSLDLIIPEKHRDAHWRGYRTVMETGVTRYGKEPLKVPALRKDGTRISIEFAIVLIRHGEGPVLGAVALMSDVTERWQQDRETRKRLTDLEARLANLGKS
ncbi:MAG: PAS domain-containing protein [Thermoplasmata archaeon]